MKKGSRSADKEIRKLERSTARMGKTAAVAKGAMGTLFAGLSGAIVIRQATKAIADFEETLATVKGVTRATAEEFELLEATAKRLGATTRFTASEVGEGLLFLARAGFSVSESMAAVGATLDLASAGALSLGEAADFASNIVTQFGLTAEDTVRVVDSLVNVSNTANTNVRQMAEAMKFAGPIAGALGQSIEETAAQIGILGDAGIQGGMAGTNLRQVILKLLGPTAEAARTIREMGLSLQEVSPQFNNQIDILEKLAKANLDVGDALAIFGTRNAAAGLLLARNTESIRESIKFQKEHAGGAKELADIIENTLSGAFRSLRSSVESVFLLMGDAGLAGAIRTVTDLLTDAFRVISGVNEELKSSERAVKIAVGVMKGLAAAFTTIIALKLIVFFVGLSKSILIAAHALATFNLVALANPWFAVGTAIAIAVGALVAFSDELVTIGGQQTTIANLLKRSWESIGTLIEGVADTLADKFGRMLDSTLESLKSIFEVIGITREGLAEFVKETNEFGFPLNPRARIILGRTALGDEGFEQLLRDDKARQDANFGATIDLTDPSERRKEAGIFENTLLLAARDTQQELLELDKQRALRAEERTAKLKEFNDEQDRVMARRVQGAKIQHEVLLANLKLQLEENVILEDTVKLADKIGDAFADAFTEAIIGAKDLKEAIKELGQEIARLVVKQSISQPIATAISGAVDPFIQRASGFAAGLFAPSTATTVAQLGTGITSRPAGGTNEDFAAGFFGLIPRMAEGGIITSKRLAILGESGPEVVIPLSRDGQMRMGNTTINMVVNTPDANSFRKSRVQIASDLKRLTGVAR